MTRDELIRDKNRMDYITEKIANKKRISIWVIFYWQAVAIGHLLEWTVTKRSK